MFLIFEIIINRYYLYFCCMNNFVTYKGIKIHFSVQGSGSAVVLLHGFLEDSSMWNDVTKELNKKYKVICIDLLGHGKTDCLGYVHTMEEMANTIKTVLKSIRIRKVTLIGHSMGGYVALAFAESNLNYIKGLCLLNSTAQGDNEERKKLRLRAIEMAQKNYKALVSMSINNLFLQEKRKDIIGEIEVAKNIALATSAQSYVACTEGMRIRKNREFVLQSLTEKKIIIAGKQDPVLDYSLIKEEVMRTNTPLITLPFGHMCHLESPKEFLIAVQNFLKQK